jgi:DNA-binding response OmpR family regulator
MPPKRILVIDDENDIQEVARLSLQLTENWMVMSANGGAAGTLLALSEGPDAILLDVMMPDMDGPTTLRVLQQQGVTIPVIFLTALFRNRSTR